MIPFGDLRRTYRRLQDEIDPAIASVLADGWFVLGRRLVAFEEAFAAYCGASHAVGVGNGTDAIALALRALGIGAGDEVITTPLSAAFTALGISQCGATPVFADVEYDRCTIDPARIEAAITPRSRAVVPVHLYGQPAGMDGIAEVARRHGLLVVEDAAQAHGASFAGARAGALADAAAFSFYPSKNLGAFGDGGAVTTRDAAVARRVRLLRDGGQSERYRHEAAGVNSRLDELQAAILQVRLAHLDADNERRRWIAARYRRALSGVEGIVPPPAPADSESVYHLFVVRSRARDRLVAHLSEAGVATAIHYPTPIHVQPAYGGPRRRGEMPNAERIADEVLSLPIYPELTDDEVERVCAALSTAGALAPEPEACSSP